MTPQWAEAVLSLPTPVALFGGCLLLAVAYYRREEPLPATAVACFGLLLLDVGLR